MDVCVMFCMGLTCSFTLSHSGIWAWVCDDTVPTLCPIDNCSGRIGPGSVGRWCHRERGVCLHNAKASWNKAVAKAARLKEAIHTHRQSFAYARLIQFCAASLAESYLRLLPYYATKTQREWDQAAEVKEAASLVNWPFLKVWRHVQLAADIGAFQQG